MDIEIELVGKSDKWVLKQPFIRIGRSAKCEVGLPAKQYRAVALEHLVLEVTEESVKLAGGSGETLLNDRQAAAGAAVQSGDILRLGVGGPELRIRFQQQEQPASKLQYEPTRLMQASEVPVYEPTRVDSIPAVVPRVTERIPAVEASGKSAAAAHLPTSVQAPYAPFAAKTAVPGTRPERGPTGWRQEPWKNDAPVVPPATAASAPGSGDPRNQDARLKLVQSILLANLAVLVILFVWIFQLNRQLVQTRSELRELRVQAQTAVGQFTPALDEKLGVFEKDMDGFDDRLKVAEDRMESRIDQKMKSTEDHMVNRMNAEIPLMLDKFAGRKLGEAKN